MATTSQDLTTARAVASANQKSAEFREKLLKAGVHGLLILWILYSVVPFVWTIIGSTQRTRDATAREPRFMPEAVYNDPLPYAIGVMAFLVVMYIIGMVVTHEVPSRLGIGMLVAFTLLVGTAIMLIPEYVSEDNLYAPITDNYKELWLEDGRDAENFSNTGIGLLTLGIILFAAAVNANRLPISNGFVYMIIGIVLMLVGIILPRMVEMAEFYEFFINSIIVTVWTVVISISIGCLAGYGLARYSGKIGFVILLTALAFRALPRMAFVLPYYYFAQQTGLYDTHVMLIITLVAINQPFTIWMLRSFFTEIPREIEEAAMIDGAGRLQAFVRVIIPIMWPGIITTALFTLLLAYNEFLMARVLTSQNWTLPVAIVRFTSGEDTRFITLASASAVSITLPIVFIIIFFQKYLIKGLASGAVKG